MRNVRLTILATALVVPSGILAQTRQGMTVEDITRGLRGGEIMRGTAGATRGTAGVAASAPSAAPSDPPRVALPIQFEYDSAEISPESRPLLANVAAAITSSELAEVRIRIEGHTDQAGSDAYNLRLSEMRARAVKRYLVERLAIAPERLETRGYGEARPLADVSQATEEGRDLNRRVEFVNLGRPDAAQPKPSIDEVQTGRPAVRMAVTANRGGRVTPLRAGETLTSTERYRITFTPQHDTHVYLYQIDSSGKIQALFPNPELSSASNPVRGGQSYELPFGGRWLTLDANQGEEQIVTVAARQPLADPKALAFDHWERETMRGTAPAPRPGMEPLVVEEVFLDRFHFVHR